jgi:hypothetical protein
MTQYTIVERQVIDVLCSAKSCDLEELMRQCANLTWNQVFLAVDRLSRCGELMLAPRGRGTYTVTFLQRQEYGSIDAHSPLNHTSSEGGYSCLL